MFSVTKELKFCAAHRLPSHKGLCKNIHGHNYKVLITISAPHINPENNMVIDFSDIKNKFQFWIDKNLDHAIILDENDYMLANIFDCSYFRIYKMSGEPTAENMARMIALLDKSISSVTVYETDTSFATYSGAGAA